MARRFQGSVVWITGGGSGIGRSLALAFAREGADVAISGRREDRLREVVAEIEALGTVGFAVACDVAKEEDVQAAVDRIVGAFGRIDVVVANAGFGVTGAIDALSADEWRRQLDVNVVGAAMTARYTIPHLEAHRGRLVFVGSVAAHVGLPKQAAYCASKAAVRALGLTASSELAPRGISVTTIHPGFVESEIAQVDNSGTFRAERKDRRPHKLMWSSERAAAVMLDAIYRRKREHTFTGHGKVGVFFGQHMPGLTQSLVARSASKGRKKDAP